MDVFLKKIQKKNQQKTFKINNKTALILAVVAALLLGIFFIQYYVKPTLAQVDVFTIREAIIKSAELTKKPAPVDAKTGDVYFPEAKLYIPNPGGLDALTYDYYQNDQTNDEAELSIANRRIFGATSSKLYTASNLDELFAMLPVLQACQRGITLRYSMIPPQDAGDRILTGNVTLNNSKTLYLYKDKVCTDLEISSTIDIVKTIRAY